MFAVVNAAMLRCHRCFERFAVRHGCGPVTSYDGAPELERGPDVLLTGLATTLSPAVAVRPAETERLAE